MDRKIVLTCEHAGNNVPDAYEHLFQGHEDVLATHRGYDIGALELARTFSKVLDVELMAHFVTRLLIDLNRSLYNPSAFSEFTKKLNGDDKQQLIRTYYERHRGQVEEKILSLIQKGNQVLHLAVHTFTPMLDGVVRNADVGLLYDPSRVREKNFCEAWEEELKKLLPAIRIRMNYPYRGTMDGFNTLLRKEYEPEHYLGIELEVNQKFAESGDRTRWDEIQQVVASSLLTALQREPVNLYD